MARRPSTVVVDTNVFSADLLRTTRPLVDLYRPVLEGRRFLISFQTLAELEYGFQRRDWGPTRLGQARDHVRRAEVVWPGPALLATYVELRVSCEREGHALGQPDHGADRWIAATAIHLAVPLVSHDGIFRDAPRLDFETVRRVTMTIAATQCHLVSRCVVEARGVFADLWPRADFIHRRGASLHVR